MDINDYSVRINNIKHSPSFLFMEIKNEAIIMSFKKISVRINLILILDENMAISV